MRFARRNRLRTTLYFCAIALAVAGCSGSSETGTDPQPTSVTVDPTATATSVTEPTDPDPTPAPTATAAPAPEPAATSTASPVAGSVDYNLAPDDGDSFDTPVTDRLPNAAINPVSAPEGDREDWFRFQIFDLLEDQGADLFSDNAEIEVAVSCSDGVFISDGAQLVATLFDDRGTVLTQLVCNEESSADSRPARFDQDGTYFLQVEMQGVGSASWTWGLANGAASSAAADT